MASIPKTSVSLIRALADDPQSGRWDELYLRYEGAMRAFLAAKFPTLEADDVLQEAMVALSRRIPEYRYAPDEKGHFRNYLLGILRHKAADAVAARMREADAREGMRKDSSPARPDADDAAEWRRDALEVALGQLMSDAAVNPMHRAVFRHVALEGESPESVAARFGVSRDNVDQIKRRMLERLKRLVSRMTEE